VVVLDELAVHRWIKESKQELSQLRKEYEEKKTKELRFLVKLKQIEVKLAELKLINMKKRGNI
jgi:hypothetical protein